MRSTTNTAICTPLEVCAIDWQQFTSQDTEDIRDGMSPEDYVRALRDFDREETILE